MSEKMKKWDYDNKQDRIWTFTASVKHFGSTDSFIALLNSSGYQWTFQEEKGAENGFVHYQGYLKSDTPIRGRTLRNFFSDSANIWFKGRRKETELYNYVRKEDTRISGPYSSDLFDAPSEKNRIDTVQSLVDRLNEGERLNDLYLSDVGSSYAIPYLERVNAAIMEKKSRTYRKVTTRWLGGRTRTGKTSGVLKHYENLGKELDVFRVTNYRWPFDKYQGEKIIVFDEFIGQIKPTDLNNLLDGYQVVLDCRQVDKFALWEEVWFISNLTFAQVFNELRSDYPLVYDALEARISAFGWKETLLDEIVWD